MFIPDVIAPPDAPQVRPVAPAPRPPPRLSLDWIDQRIVDLVREHEPVKLWWVLNVMAEELSPRSRTEGRELRIRLLGKLRRLCGQHVVFRTGINFLATVKPAAIPAVGTSRRRTRAVRTTALEKAVSAVTPPRSAEQCLRPIAVGAEVVVGHEDGKQLPQAQPKTQSAPSPAQITLAAKSLASMPRHESRKLTGYLHGQRCWRGRLLVLPSGEIAPLLWSSRGRVLLRNYRDLDLEEYLRWGGRRESAVRLHKCAAAVLLARQRAGVKERPSPLKAIAARANGRKGGRPRKPC